MFKMLALNAKMLLGRFFKKEDGDVNVVSIVVLIGIAVLLAIIFKDAIAGLLKGLFTTIEEKATEALTPPQN